MMNLLYHSHTVVPAHLEELSALEVLEPHEQVLAALDGVLLDQHGRRISGPTLHDYCLITDARVVLWARDYAQHLCYAFPLTDLRHISGHGVDPIHGALELGFATDDAELLSYRLTLVAQAHLAPFTTLLRTAAGAAQHVAGLGADAETTALEVVTALGAVIYGSEDAIPPHQAPYRWPGAEHREPSQPQPAFTVDPAQLPPNSLFTAGRFARSAWDTLRRSLRDTDLPFDLSPGSVREFTDAVRAVNDLVQSVVNNPSAQQLAMAFINNRRQSAEPAATATATAAAPVRSAPMPVSEQAAEQPAEAVSTYREIPLRRRSSAVSGPRAAAVTARTEESTIRLAAPVATSTPDRREIPLRRRVRTSTGQAALVSGSGDAERDTGP
jgi:hypothetical protein